MLRTRVLAVLASIVCVLAGALPASAAVGDITIFKGGFAGGGNGVGRMAVGPDGNIWFTADGAIGRLTPDGTYTYFKAGLTTGSLPGPIVAGPDGNLWFTQNNTPFKAGRVTPDGTITEHDIGIVVGVNGFPVGIAAGADGNLWVTIRGATTEPNRVVKLVPSGGFTPFPVPTANPVLTPTRATLGPDGNVWAVDAFAKQVIRIDGGGGMAAFGAGISGVPNGITTAPDGNLWFTESGAVGRVARMTTAGAVAEFSNGISANPGLSGIAADALGNIWFAEANVSRIGRLASTGVVTEYPLALGSQPLSMVTGPDGNVWFSSGSGIGRIVTGAAPPPDGPSPEDPGGGAEPPPGPGPANPPPQAGVSRAATIGAKRIVVGANRRVSVSLGNPNAVTAAGELTLVEKVVAKAGAKPKPQPKRRGRRPTTVTLATKRFTIAAGTRVNVTATLPKKAWERLQSAQRLKVDAKVVLRAGGTSMTKTFALTLVPAAAGKRR